MSLLELDGLRLQAGARCLIQPLSLRIEAGEQVALIGASGAGKTSLLHALALALAPADGHLRLGGQDAWALSHAARHRLRRQLMLAPQHPPLPPRQRVVTAVLAGLLPGAGLGTSLRMLFSPSADQARVAFDALDRLELGNRLWSRVDQLSGGERQRVALARLLVSRAALWLVDEPLSALDPQRAQRSLAVLQEAARAQQRTLVCSLHQVELARSLFPRVVALREGRLVYDGPSHGLDDALLEALYAGLDDRPPSAADDDAQGGPGDATLSRAVPQAMCR
ncbi:phosphonate ABC transporter ATP-binding protein [Roseateles amylovorans]|uniref:ATP-binding cassette domain-containing protein n=1 Tax=Roseateles amylovorans TaxID=2978473 RepID=A0ABY6B3E6_9BURK|nr:ATP-binding cassette domain-containing protein [Roseateles amylovorans]UXH79908.1 ATP-binding cassette domain-containing protein [Roseateles amylovorans]